MTPPAPSELGVVTIDGPAASGKSTVARMVAQRLGVPFVSSGLLYRCASFLALRSGRSPDEGEALVDELRRHDVRLLPAAGGNRVLVDGRDVSSELHTDEIDAVVSRVASHERVRAWVDARLRELEGPMVVEGRDMGTAVFPEARHKFYLTAPADVRARRRLGERGAALGAITEALLRRDELDAKQLAPADDALLIDTGALAPEDVVARILAALAPLGRT